MALPRDTRPWGDISGPDPFLVAQLSADRYVGALRGNDRLDVLDGDARVLSSLAAPTGVTGWSWTETAGYAVGEGSAEVFAYHVADGTIREAGRWSIPGVHALRDIAIGPAGRLYLADRHRSRIVATAGPVFAHERDPSPRNGQLDAPDLIGDCPGAIAVRQIASMLLANCLLSHRIEAWGLDDQGVPDGRRTTIEHDGPIWGFAARLHDEHMSLAVVGVEDHPLDRADGAFGYIDSFLFVYELEHDDASLRFERSLVLNVSEHGVVTPKWVQWTPAGEIWLTAYGSWHGILLDPRVSPLQVRAFEMPPGVTQVAGEPRRALGASPLLDAWVVLQDDDVDIVPATASSPMNRHPLARVGEALFFTSLMAPANDTEGQHSRFTCETCHFEGTVDGRTHSTGRDDVHATTKTLRGLIGNRPHFSRALDPTTTIMIDNEFRVAGRGSPLDPWFPVQVANYPWLGNLLDGDRTTRTLDPLALRHALFEFLVEFNPESNPTVRGRDAFGPIEQRGADRFAEHCESCHQARLRADDPSTRQPRSTWESRIFGAADILWAMDERSKTGVEPYVHPDGARVPSLRRLFAKRPYFTNGRAPDLVEVLQRVDLGPPFTHDRAETPSPHPLEPDDREALLAFLDLL